MYRFLVSVSAVPADHMVSRRGGVRGATKNNACAALVLGSIDDLTVVRLRVVLQ